MRIWIDYILGLSTNYEQISAWSPRFVPAICGLCEQAHLATRKCVAFFMVQLYSQVNVQLSIDKQYPCIIAMLKLAAVVKRCEGCFWSCPWLPWPSHLVSLYKDDVPVPSLSYIETLRSSHQIWTTDADTHWECQVNYEWSGRLSEWTQAIWS